MQEENIMSLTTTGTGDLRDKIYTIRGYQVMLDRDLAIIYGYETRTFNQQVKNNIDRFSEEFRFQLTREEFELIEATSQRLISKNLTSNSTRGGTRKLPYVFTEYGIYMLMTILKGERATQQSIALIKLFKSMKDYLMQHPPILPIENQLLLPQINDNTQRITRVEGDLTELKDVVENSMVTHNDLSEFIRSFSAQHLKRDYIFYKNQILEAKAVFDDIFSEAEKSIFLVDNYISIKTLLLFKDINVKIKVTIFSDQLAREWSEKDLKQFHKEYPQVKLHIKPTRDLVHDRFIVIDYKQPSQKAYICGGSPKRCRQQN